MKEYVSHACGDFCDEGGSHFRVEMDIMNKYRVTSEPHGLYNIYGYGKSYYFLPLVNMQTILLVTTNYQWERRIIVNHVYDQLRKEKIKLRTVPVKTTMTVLVKRLTVMDYISLMNFLQHSAYIIMCC